MIVFNKTADQKFEQTIRTVVTAVARLSARQHGALIILQRLDNLEEYIQSGVRMDASATPELLLQIFYPNTPLHDGAAILAGPKVVAAACVMPLSSSGILNRSPERQMGLRHRAALGISEESDAIAVVVSEETGAISIAHAGRMIRRIDPERLESILIAFFQPTTNEGIPRWCNASSLPTHRGRMSSPNMLTRLADNLRLFLWALALALAVWLAAVTSSDPDEVRIYPAPVNIQIVGQDLGLIMMGNMPKQAEITLRVPCSVWDKLTAKPDSVRGHPRSFGSETRGIPIGSPNPGG